MDDSTGMLVPGQAPGAGASLQCNAGGDRLAPEVLGTANCPEVRCTLVQ